MAAADAFEIIVTGSQAHGSSPWRGVDPIVVGAQIVSALQTIVSRNVDITRLPAIVSVGQFQSGVRNNIIPDTARLVGTIRTFDDEVQKDIHARVTQDRGRDRGRRRRDGRRSRSTAAIRSPRTIAALTARMLPTLERVAPARSRSRS